MSSIYQYLRRVGTPAAYDGNIDDELQPAGISSEENAPIPWPQAIKGFRASYLNTMLMSFDKISRQTRKPYSTVAIMGSANEYLDWCLQQGQDPDRLSLGEQRRIVRAALEYLTAGTGTPYDVLADTAGIGHRDPDLERRLRFKVNMEH